MYINSVSLTCIDEKKAQWGRGVYIHLVLFYKKKLTTWFAIFIKYILAMKANLKYCNNWKNVQSKCQNFYNNDSK